MVKLLKSAIIIAMLLAAIVFSVCKLPYIKKINYVYEGWEISVQDIEYAEPVTLTFEGEIHRYLFKPDYFIGKIYASGYTFSSELQVHQGLTSDVNELYREFRISLEGGGGFLLPTKTMGYLKKGDFQLLYYYGDKTLKNAIIKVQDNQSPEANHDYYIVAPSENAAGAREKVNDLQVKWEQDYNTLN